MSKKIIEQINDLIEYKKDIKDEDLLEMIKQFANHGSPADRTLANRFSLIKKHLKAMGKYTDKFLKQVKPPDEITNKIIDMDKQTKTNKTQIEFSQTDVDKLLSLKDSNDLLDKFIYLQFVSGRRINEIYEGNLGIVYAKEPQIIRMELSKKRDLKDDKFPVFILPVIGAKEWKAKLVTARTALVATSLSSFTKYINARLRFHFSKRFTSHSLRGMYAVYAYERYNPSNQNINGFIGKILDHGDSGESSLNYSNYVFMK